MLHPSARSRLAGTVVSAAVAVAACTEAEVSPEEVIEATEIWSQPEGSRNVFQPQDLEPVSRTSAWIADTGFGVLTKISRAPAENATFGQQDKEPVEVVQPLRIGVSREHGLVVYDLSRRMVDVFTEDGQLIRSFDPGVVPSVLDVTTRPIGVVYASLLRSDSLTTLLVTGSDYRGEAVDTLLGPDVGPFLLRAIQPAPAHTSIVPSGRGFWIWYRAIPDTVYEVAHPAAGARKIVVDGYEEAVGVLSDSRRDMLWFVSNPGDGVRYDGLDVGEAGEAPYRAPLVARRVTPKSFAPKGIYDGAVLGWLVTATDRYRLASYELLPAEGDSP